MTIATRQQFAEYCLRALGAPVLEINIDDDQLEDRIDEALEYWRQYHHEGIEKMYLKQLINASVLTLTTGNGSSFPLSSVVTGQTSGAKAIIIQQMNKTPTSNELVVRYVQGTFVAGETVTTTTSAGTTITGTLATTNFYTEGETERHYFEVPDAVYGVTRVIPFTSVNYSSKSIFDIQYQLRLNDLYDLTSTSIVYYKSVMAHLALLDLELNGKPMCRFNRMQNRIYLDTNWADNITPGQYIVVEGYRALDPTQFARIWNEAWLKHYTTALIKRQWAVNLKKFSGIQLPGGVTLDGQSMYVEAMQEIKDLEDELQNKAAPLEFFLG